MERLREKEGADGMGEKKVSSLAVIRDEEDVYKRKKQINKGKQEKRRRRPISASPNESTG
jgi:hypothetical protein